MSRSESNCSESIITENVNDNFEFACEALRQEWNQHGSLQYQTAGSILLLRDSGGSNSSR